MKRLIVLMLCAALMAAPAAAGEAVPVKDDSGYSVVVSRPTVTVTDDFSACDMEHVYSVHATCNRPTSGKTRIRMQMRPYGEGWQNATGIIYGTDAEGNPTWECELLDVDADYRLFVQMGAYKAVVPVKFIDYLADEEGWL